MILSFHFFHHDAHDRDRHLIHIQVLLHDILCLIHDYAHGGHGRDDRGHSGRDHGGHGHSGRGHGGPGHCVLGHGGRGHSGRAYIYLS